MFIAGETTSRCKLTRYRNLNARWGYVPPTHAGKPADQILQTMRRAKEAQAVFFLNVGPRLFGDIHPDEQRVLREIGRGLRPGRAREPAADSAG